MPGPDRNNWYENPTSSHLVQYFSRGHQLIDNLENYIGTGIVKGETCIVIATSDHREQLEGRLKFKFDLDDANRSGRYVPLDASETLANFMLSGSPSPSLFYETIGHYLKQAEKRGKPIRAFGEMVTLLWKVGNAKAVIDLENLWNEIAKDYDFSLYCAYPELYFVMNPEVQNEIDRCHDIQSHGMHVSPAY